MKVSILNLHCLNSLSDDQENIAAIVSDVRLATYGDVTVSEVTACLNELISEGLVSQSADASGTHWYQLTKRGREELDANWVAE